MPIRALGRARERALFLFVFVVVSSALTGLALAQQKGKEQKGLDKVQTQEMQALVKMVNDASAGQPPASDFQITWQAHFLKARDQKTFVPFSIAIEPEKLTGSAIAMYVRAVKRGGDVPASGQAAQKDQKDQKKGPEYAFQDIQFIDLKAEPGKGTGAGTGTVAQPYRFSRALWVSPGEYDVWVAIKERTPAGAGGKDKGTAPTKAAVIKQGLTAPDFWSDQLLTSSVIVAEKVEPLTTAVPESDVASHPYAFGNMELVPALVNKFSKKNSVSLLFFVYNAGLDANKKPDVTVEYSFSRKVDGGEKPFNKTEPQKFNAETLPPQFDAAAGHQIVAGQEIPLASFPEGDYRLEIKVTDKVANRTLTENVNLTVTP